MKALSSMGLLISLYQSWVFFQPASSSPSFCDINQFISCTTVTHSSYGFIGGIPVSFVGLAGFMALLILTFLPETISQSAGLVLGSWIGALFSTYLTYAEFFILHTVCLVCLIVFFLIWTVAIMCAWKWGKQTIKYLRKIEVVD